MQIHSKKFWLIFFIVFLVIGFFRFYKLGQIPQGLNIDAASYSYNAYSIMKTGKDEWGYKLPLTLKAFGEYKPAGLAYLMIPAIKLFGLNPFVNRLPSALFGFLTLFVLFFTLQTFYNAPYLNLFLTSIFAFSPWHFGISRLFYEANVGLFFIALSILLLFYYFDKLQNSFLYWAFLLLGVSGYFYPPFRYISIILIFIFLAVFHIYSSQKRLFIKPILVFLITIFPLLSFMFSKVGLMRLYQENKLKTFGHTLVINENRQMCYLSLHRNFQLSKLCYLFWNKPLDNLYTLYRTWTRYLSPYYLFISIDHKDIISPNYGAYLAILFPFYILGILSIVSHLNKKYPKQLFLILSVLIVPFIPSSVQEVVIHRNVVGLYLSFFILAFGFYSFFQFIVKRYRYVFYLFVVIILFFMTRFLTYYFLVFTKSQPVLWKYDAQQVFQFASTHYSHYDLIVIKGYDNAPLAFAFYSALDPNQYRTLIKRTPINQYGWTHGYALGKLQTTFNLKELLCNYNPQKRILYITPPLGQPFTQYTLYKTYSFNQVHTLHEFYDLDQLYNSLKKDHFDFQTYCRNI